MDRWRDLYDQYLLEQLAACEKRNFDVEEEVRKLKAFAAESGVKFSEIETELNHFRELLKKANMNSK